MLSDVLNLYHQSSVADVASLGSCQHSSDRNSFKRSREDQYSSSSKRQEDTQVQKKRKLDLVKCERCRIDKQKCTPTDRIWPTRCQRCITKDFPCSEGKRAQRRSKHALPESVPSNSSEKSSEEVPGKDLNHLNFLLGYQNILSEASSQLQHLQEEIFDFFRCPSYLRRSACDPREDLGVALVSISGIANDLARNQIALSSQDELRTALSNQISVSSVLSSLPTPMDSCHLCQKEWAKEWRKQWEEEGEKTCEKGREQPLISSSSIVENMIEDFKQAGAICQEVLVRQAQVSKMIRCACSDDHLAQIEEYWAQIHSGTLSINATATSVMGEAELPGIPTQRVNQICLLPGQDENNINRDFLGRTIAHQLIDLLDEKACSTLRKDFPFFRVESSHQVQDQLDRTLLHLLCQKGSYECVELSLQIGADPGATTIYGHLPLHYAAKRGYNDMCELLLSYKGRFDIDQKDKFGFTAYDYAVWRNHSEIEWLINIAAEEQRMSGISSDDGI